MTYEYGQIKRTYTGHIDMYQAEINFYIFLYEKNL